VYHPDEAACRMLEIDPSQAQSVNLVRGLPADSNFHTGFSGRTSIFEIMEVSKPIRQAILRGDSAIEIAEIAHREGMKSLSDAARNKVLSGVTSIDQMHQSMLSFTD